MKKTKFKIGDLVIANNDAPYSITTKGWKGKIRSISSAEGYIFVKNSGEALGPFEVKSEYFKIYDKMSKEAKPVAKQGDYFSATYNRKKIRGIVGIDPDGYDELMLFNNQAGEDVKCDGGTEFQFGIRIYEGLAEDIKEASVNNFVVLKDKRQKAVIDKDKLPEIGVNYDTYKVAVTGKNEFTFGCGAVILTRKEIEGYLRFRKHKIGIEDLEGSSVEDLTVEELERWLEYKKNWEGSADERLYNAVVNTAEMESHEENQLNDIPDEEIEALFDYADHVQATK